MWHESFDYSLNYIPVPKGRPRVTKSGIAFTPTKTRRAEQDLAVLISSDLQGRTPIDNPIRLEMDIYMPRPKGHYGTGKNEGNLKKSAPRFPDRKPDIDNIFKLFTDAAEGLLWTNDSRIVQMDVKLWYADERAPGYDVSVLEWREEE